MPNRPVVNRTNKNKVYLEIGKREIIDMDDDQPKQELKQKIENLTEENLKLNNDMYEIMRILKTTDTDSICSDISELQNGCQMLMERCENYSEIIKKIYYEISEIDMEL
jgi:hypothetical protein